MDNSMDIATGKLVSQVKSMAKKPTLDTNIHRILDQCLEIVDQQSVYLDNGIFDFNFAGIAIILDQVTFIYGKKVDLLWDHLLNYQKRLLQFNTNEEQARADEQRHEEHVQKYKRKRKKVPPEQPEPPPQPNPINLLWIDMDQVVDDISNDVDEERLSHNASIKSFYTDFLPEPEEELIEPYELPLCILSNYPITCDDEYICDNSHFLSIYFFIQIPDMIRQTLRIITGIRNVNMIGYDVRERITLRYLFRHGMTYSECSRDQLLAIDRHVDQVVLDRMPLQLRCQRLCPRRSSIVLTRLSEDVVQQYLERDRPGIRPMSTSGKSSVSHDSGVADLTDGLADTSDVDEEGNMPREEADGAISCVSGIEGGIESRVDGDEEGIVCREEVDGAISSVSDIEAGRESRVDGILDDASVKSVENLVSNCEGEAIVNVNDDGAEGGENHTENCDEAYYSSQDISSCENVLEGQGDSVCGNKGDFDMGRTRITLSETVTTMKQAQKKLKRVKSIRDEEEDAPQRKKPKRIPKPKLREIITKPLKDFDIFYYENYRTQIGEGDLVEPIFPSDEIESNTDHHTESNDDPGTDDHITDDPVTDEHITNDPVTDDHITHETNNGAELDDSGIIEDITIIVPIPSTSTGYTGTSTPNEEYNSTNFSDFLESEPRTPEADNSAITEILKRQQVEYAKFLEWRSEILHKLAVTDKKDFNIHEYESKVINMLPDDQPVKLKKVMAGNKSSEVVRLFVASLQLINNSNIEFLNRQPGVLANEDLEIRLLSTDRHHQNLETYQAPSLGDKIKAMRKITAVIQNSGSATPSTSGVSYKKRKLS